MLKIIVTLVIPAFVIFYSPTTLAVEEDAVFSSHFYNSVLLGTVAGLIIGLAVGQGSITTFRITSLGLYGGIVLGITTGGQTNKTEQNPVSLNSPKTPTYVFTFHY